MKSIPAKLTLLAAAVTLAACGANEPKPQAVSDFSIQELEERNQKLVEREKEVAKREAEVLDAKKQLSQNVDKQASTASSSSTTTVQKSTQEDIVFTKSQNNGGKDESGTLNEELLPPNAKSGECYARVWVEPVYQNYTETVLTKESSERVEVIPAKYETVTEKVMVKPASYSINTIPAVYAKESEQKLVKPASQQWRTDLGAGSAPAGDQVLNTAKAHGIDLDAAKPGMCFHEHYHNAKYEQVNESVLVKEAYDVIETVPAEFRWVEKQVLVKEASSRIEKVPAKYETVTEQVVDVPAHTVWKKGTGPIQKIDEATGEIMCLVDVPATFKTLSKRVLVSPASSKEVAIPAEYKTVKVKELISEAKEVKRRVPAEYRNIAVSKKVEDVSFVWHEVHDKTMSAHSRTGNKICLTETPATYKTVNRTVVVTDATTKKVEHPAEYKTVQVTKLVSAASEKRHEIPAEYKTVNLSKIDQDGYMEWRSILCDTNMTEATIKDIQNALLTQGYNPGKIDGVVGRNTMQAVNDFQSDNNLPTDKYINMDTIKALNIKL